MSTEPTNKDRAAWAAEAIDCYIGCTRGGERYANLGPAEKEEAIADFLCDLRHLCTSEMIDFDLASDRGARHFAAEIVEAVEIDAAEKKADPVIVVTTSGGIAEVINETDTTVFDIDWDAYDDGGLNDYELEDLVDILKNISNLPTAGQVGAWRKTALSDMSKLVQRKIEMGGQVCIECGTPIHWDDDAVPGGTWAHSEEAPEGTSCWSGMGRGPRPSDD